MCWQPVSSLGRREAWPVNMSGAEKPWQEWLMKEQQGYSPNITAARRVLGKGADASEPSLWTQADCEVKQIISSLSLFVKQE